VISCTWYINASFELLKEGYALCLGLMLEWKHHVDNFGLMKGISLGCRESDQERLREIGEEG
jgi:hypothetical protein